MKAVYVRVSTAGQNTDSQTDEIKRWLASNGHDHTEFEWFVDHSTGTTFSRDQFKKLDKAIQKGKVEMVVCWKLDRLSRSLLGGIQVLQRWLEHDVRFVCVTQDFDFSGPVGRIVAALLLGLAELEHATRRERQMAGIQAAKDRGKTWGGSKKGHVSKTKAHKMRRAAELHRQGMKFTEIATNMGISWITAKRWVARGEQLT